MLTLFILTAGGPGGPATPGAPPGPTAPYTGKFHRSIDNNAVTFGPWLPSFPSSPLAPGNPYSTKYYFNYMYYFIHLLDLLQVQEGQAIKK